MFKVIIAGSRFYDDYQTLSERCDHLLSETDGPIQIVSGKAQGADRLGERYAKERGYELAQFPANWEHLGLSAGRVRNMQMAKYADALIAFPIGKSTGTRHMITVARAHKLPVKYGVNGRLMDVPATHQMQ
jgi:hypothetical protein